MNTLKHMQVIFLSLVVGAALYFIFFNAVDATAPYTIAPEEIDAQLRKLGAVDMYKQNNSIFKKYFKKNKKDGDEDIYGEITRVTEQIKKLNELMWEVSINTT